MPAVSHDYVGDTGWELRRLVAEEVTATASCISFIVTPIHNVRALFITHRHLYVNNRRL